MAENDFQKKVSATPRRRLAWTVSRRLLRANCINLRF